MYTKICIPASVTTTIMANADKTSKTNTIENTIETTPGISTKSTLDNGSINNPGSMSFVIY